MLSFRQFLIEKDVELYSWQPDYFLKDILDPKTRRPISIFSDQSQALAYPSRTAGHLIGQYSLLTGTTPTSNLRPDIEWNSGAYNQMFADLDVRMKAGERPPTLMNPTNNPNFYRRFRDRFVTPGAAIQTDPVTGQKNIVAGWKPVLMEPQEVPGFDPRYVETGWENVSKPGVVPGIRKFNQKTGQYEDPIRWGGSATIPLQNEPDIMGFPETRQVDVLGRKTDVKKATEALLKKIEMGEFDPNKDLFSGFRVVDPKKVSLRPDGRTTDINPFKTIKIEGQPTQIPTKQATPSGARRAMSTRPTMAAIAAASGAGGMATGINVATDVSGILTPPTPRDRMQGEKSWGTDTGVGFDLGDDGELVASPEGFKAVKQREKEGRSFPGPYAR